MADISPDELQQRVLVIKRFKELLKSQRERFNAYLDTLDRQKDIIQTGSADELLRHVDLEEKLVTDIFSIQKVIDPLEKMYKAAHGTDPVSVLTPALKGTIPEGKQLSSDKEVFSLQEALNGLKTEAVTRSERNRELLSRRMSELRSEIKTLQNNPYAKRSDNSILASGRIDISG